MPSLSKDEARRLAAEVLARCDTLAAYTETPGQVTRTFLCNAMHDIHFAISDWMGAAGLVVGFDPLANLRGSYPASRQDAPILILGSHLDTVPNAGKYDGVLGVLLGLAAVQALGGARLPFFIDVIGFSEEEGIRFRTPYLGSLAVCGRFDPRLLERTDADGVTMAYAIRNFGPDPADIPNAAYPPGRVLAYVEPHIEQGPVLDDRDVPLGLVTAIIGQSRLWFRFEGQAGHAGTLPMDLRHDALAAAAEFIVEVEKYARSVDGLRATVGSLTVSPGAVNVVPGGVRLSLDFRHADDAIRRQAMQALLERAAEAGERRGVRCRMELSEDYPAVPTDTRLTQLLEDAARDVGHAPLRMVSGAGHDAAVMASIAPTAMLFVRSPGGVSHHPDEAVRLADVQAALEVLVSFLYRLAGVSA